MKKEELKINATDSQILKISFIGLIGLLLATVIQAQRPAQGLVSDKKYSPEELGYQLVWNDEFEGKQLNSTK